MPSSLKLRLQDDMKIAMRAQDKARLGTIRLILAAVKQYEVDQRQDPDDAVILTILEKMTKQRKESIAQYAVANRQDLVDQEQFELDLIKTYFPIALNPAEIDQLINEALANTAAKSIADMSKVMAALKPVLTGRADIGEVSAKIKALLTAS